jgi:hypothetical protein
MITRPLLISSRYGALPLATVSELQSALPTERQS